MSKANAKKQDDSSASKASKVKVRITKMGTHTCGGVFAAGAIITIPADKAATLAELGQAAILGTP